jgi:hypothetical protein
MEGVLMRRYPTRCPSCGGPMIITELSCTACETTVRGRYSGDAFATLSDENLRFLEIFVTCRGNIKEMERETGLGYWTIRNRLDTIIEALQAVLAPSDDVEARRREILRAVERGDLSLIEAERMLADLGHQAKP